MLITNAKAFSYAFDPLFAGRYIEFWKNFIADPSANLEKIKKDPVLFVEMCCKTISKDPVTRLLSVKQLELFDMQKDYLHSLHIDVFINQRPAVLLKSRQMGASWLTCAFALWVAIFHPHQVILFTTMRKEDLYKEMDPMTLMGKVEYMLANLPKIFKEHAIYHQYIIARQFKINGCILKGVTGKQAGRSQTASLTVNDEFAYNINQKAMLSSMKNACSANIFLSTLQNPDDEFDRMRYSDAYIQLRMYWKDDPRIKNQEEFKRDYIAKNGQDDFDREMDMKFSQGDKNYVFDHNWIEALPELTPKTLSYNFPKVAGFDAAGLGKDLNVIIIRQGPHILYVDSWNKCFASESFERIMESHNECPFDVLVFDEVSVGYAIASEVDRNFDMIPFEVYGFNGSTSGKDDNEEVMDDLIDERSRKVYMNLRSRMYWVCRERIRKTVEGTANDFELSYVEDFDILREMKVLTYDEDLGKIRIMSKKTMKDRKIKSPDFLDAYVYTYYAEEMAMDDRIYEEIYK